MKILAGGNDTVEDMHRVVQSIPSAYTIWKDGAYWRAESNIDANDDLGPEDEPNVLVTDCISGLPSNGGKIAIRDKLVFYNTVLINKNGVIIDGIGESGDLYFTRDGTYHGVTNKGTCIVADGIDAFHIGSSSFNFGITLSNLTIVGKDTDAAQAAGVYTAGAGINITRGNTIGIKNVQVEGKQYGVYADTGAFAFDKVIDALTVDRLYLSFCNYGVYTPAAWIANSQFTNVRGYINNKGLLHMNSQYENLFDTISSVADNYTENNIRDVPIYMATKRDLTMRHISVQGSSTAVNGLIYIEVNEADGLGANVILDDLILAGSGTIGTAPAITVDGTGGQVQIKSLTAGVHDTSDLSYYGGSAKIGSVVFVTSLCNTNVIVDGGWVDSVVAEKCWWFFAEHHANQIKVQNVKGVNDIGNKPLCFSDDAGINTLGLTSGDPLAIAPTASTAYTVSGLPGIVVTSTDSGNANCNITLKSSDGTTMVTGLHTLSVQYIPNGWTVNWGAFTGAAPTVTVVFT